MENFVEIGYNDTHICPDEESVRLAKENPGENFSPFTFIQVPQKISDILSAQRDTGNGVYAGVISKQETPKQLIKRLLEKHGFISDGLGNSELPGYVLEEFPPAQTSQQLSVPTAVSDNMLV